MTVSSSALHKDTRSALNLLQTSDTVAVTHYNEVEGYLVAPARYDRLVEQAANAEEREFELATTLPLLLAAVRAGAPIPSATLERFLPTFNIAEHWRGLAEFAATFPVTFNTGEDGEPIARGHISTAYGYITESGTDDELNLD